MLMRIQSCSAKYLNLPHRKNSTHRFYFKNTLGKQGNKDVYKSIDDYWFSKKRLDELLNSNEIMDAEFNIKKIASEI